MAISEKKRAELVEWGLSPEFLGRIETRNSADAKDALDAGVESKEAEQPEQIEAEAEVVETPEVEAEDVQEDKAAEKEATIAEEEQMSEDKERAEEAPKQDNGDLIKAVESLIKIVHVLNERFEQLETDVKGLKQTDEVKLAEKARYTPAASLSAMAESLEKSVIGNEEARVDGRTTLGKSGPEEVKPTVEPRTGIPWVDDMISRNAS